MTGHVPISPGRSYHFKDIFETKDEHPIRYFVAQIYARRIIAVAYDINRRGKDEPDIPAVLEINKDFSRINGRLVAFDGWSEISARFILLRVFDRVESSGRH